MNTCYAGTHIYKWEYAKDGSMNVGSDCVWVDYIIFPNGFDIMLRWRIDTENTVDFGELDDFTSERIDVINFVISFEGLSVFLSHSLLVRKVFVVLNLALELNVMRTL